MTSYQRSCIELALALQLIEHNADDMGEYLSRPLLDDAKRSQEKIDLLQSALADEE